MPHILHDCKLNFSYFKSEIKTCFTSNLAQVWCGYRIAVTKQTEVDQTHRRACIYVPHTFCTL